MMSEPVTLEYLSRQCDRLLAELQATRELMRETTAIMQRCIVHANEVQRLMDEFLSLSASLECD